MPDKEENLEQQTVVSEEETNEQETGELKEGELGEVVGGYSWTEADWASYDRLDRGRLR